MQMCHDAWDLCRAIPVYNAVFVKISGVQLYSRFSFQGTCMYIGIEYISGSFVALQYIGIKCLSFLAQDYFDVEGKTKKIFKCEMGIAPS